MLFSFREVGVQRFCKDESEQEKEAWGDGGSSSGLTNNEAMRRTPPNGIHAEGEPLKVWMRPRATAAPSVTTIGQYYYQAQKIHFTMGR